MSFYFKIIYLFKKNKTGQLIAVEVKSGGATRTAKQIAKDKVIASGRGKAPTGLADKNATDIIINEKHVPLWRLKND